MPTSGESLFHKLMSTETEWNPKVVLGRIVLRVLPERAIHPLKKAYYGYLITHTSEEGMEKDAIVANGLISEGDTVLDIGANLGFFSRFFAKRVGPSGLVYAFEPIPQTYDFLTNNMHRLALTNVKCLYFALSDTNKTDTMVIPTYRWGQECWYDARIKTEKANPTWRQIQIESRTLDDFFKGAGGIPKISFIKCDANYHELAVLRGALETIRSCHPAMLIEVNPDPDNQQTTAFATFELLRNEGYEAYRFDGQKLSRRKPGERSQNYFFLLPEHIRLLQAKQPAGICLDLQTQVSA